MSSFQQTFITGTVNDALSGYPLPSPPTMQLLVQATGEPYPVSQRQDDTGNFAFYGDPRYLNTQRPDDPAASLNLQLILSVTTHQTETLDIELDPVQLTTAESSLTINGRPVEVLEFPNLPLQVTAVLLPNPVHLGGRVVDAADPTIPLVDAEVEIIAPTAVGPVTTDDDGFFTLLNMPVVETVTVRVSRTGFTTLESAVRLDYRQALNQHIFALAT